jgi:phospholipid/cholesterol/gamma-HCH transport system substrate-binding protein
MTNLVRSVGAHRRAALVSAVALLALALGIVDFSGTDAPKHQVVAQFVDASPLIAGNDVKVDGVKVGTVSKLAVVDGLAQVTMNLTDAAYPLHADARATVQPVTLLGERYVNLQRGSADAPLLKAGQVLTTAHTGQATDLDQVLDTLDDPTGTALAALVTTLGEGAQGNGTNIAATLKALAPAMNDTTALARVLDAQNKQLTGMLDSLQPVASSLAGDHGHTLQALVTSADQLLGTTSANEAALRQVLGRLPATLRTANTTLADLSGTANTATPVLQSIRPVTDNLTQISTELDQFAAAANPALASAGPVLAKARQLLTQAQPVVAQLQAAGPSLRSVAHSARPLVDELSGNLDNVFNFLKYWALTTNGYDGLSHYFRAAVVVTPRSVTGLVPGLGGSLGIGGSPAGTQRTHSSSGKHAKQKGLLGTVQNLLGGLTGGLLAPSTNSSGSVTGLTRTQERGGLLALLGLGGN